MTGAAPFVGTLAAGVIDQDLAHDAGRHREEMRAVLPLRLFLIYQPNISFMDQSRCLQRVVRPFAAEVSGREPAKLVVNQRYQLRLGVLASFPQFNQQLRDVSKS